MSAGNAIAKKIQGALWGMYIGDALSMPVHWYYDRSQIFRDFGKDGITTYREPVTHFPGSIMNLSNTGGGGRGSDKDSIVGNVILHGKKKFWLRGSSYHYHHGMKAGENTLDTLVARLLVQSINASENRDFVNGRSKDQVGTAPVTPSKNPLVCDFLDRYVPFMTTPDTHNDVYAATAHRMFFANYANGTDKFKCADNDGHNTDSIDGIINVIPISLNCALVDSLNEGQKSTTDHRQFSDLIADVINAIRKSKRLPIYGVFFHELLYSIIMQGTDLRTGILNLIEAHPRYLGKLNKKSLESYRTTRYLDRDPMSACYIDSNFSVLLMLAYKYADNPEQALLAGSNAGGENVNRNALLGALMGAHHGIQKWNSKLINGLVLKQHYEKEIQTFVAPLVKKNKL